MRFFSTLNNVKAHEWGLTIQQAYLFSWFYELPSWADKVMIGEDIYYFASKNKAVEELPLLTDKTDTMYRYYKQVEEAKLILIKKIDGKDYISLTTKGKTWNFSQSDNSENNPTILGKSPERNSENNPTYKDISINKDIIDYNKLILYFNKVFTKNAKVINPEIKTAFNKRLKQGYSKEDIVKVIDNCYADNFHKEKEYKHVTLEFLSRPKIFERYASQEHKKPVLPQQQNGNIFYNQ